MKICTLCPEAISTRKELPPSHRQKKCGALLPIFITPRLTISLDITLNGTQPFSFTPRGPQLAHYTLAVTTHTKSMLRSVIQGTVPPSVEIFAFCVVFFWQGLYGLFPQPKRAS
ncbi:hypothetical protein OCU04_011820 [Sclerotinia nivalis]|uniref:Uncharacterized protein n=1 Tax=Sclerotinia nivalis TaxID=352851 RepID=A0A9X0DDJ0_9HELO|nr:hypothetical protein OCU04_011820 [Sclerotinia nivalis]